MENVIGSTRRRKGWLMGSLALLLALALACGASAPTDPQATSALPPTSIPSAGHTPQATPAPAVQPTDAPTVSRTDVKIVLAAEPPGLDMFQTSGSEHSTIYRENMTDLISW